MSLNQVFQSDKAYKIRRQGSGYHYRVSVDKRIMERAGIEHKQRLGVQAEITDDGFVSLVYTTDAGSAPLSISATNRSSVGEVVIPSGIGAVFNLEGEEARSTLYSESGDVEVHLVTSRRVDEVDIAEGEPLSMCRLDHIEQDISSGGNSWQQEQFRLYMNTDDLAVLGWAVNETIGVKVHRKDSKPVLVFDGDEEDVIDKMQKTVSETGKSQVDGLLYVPNDIVRTLNLVDTEFMWVATGNQLIALPQE